MSVFTPVTRRALEPFLTHFDVGELVNFHGISEGVENTNYFVDTTAGQYVLTLFERLDYDQLPYFLGLMAHLNAAGVPTPAPMPTLRAGELSQPLLNKPAALVQRIEGIGVADPSAKQCAAVGRALAQLHTVGQGFGKTRPPDRSVAWWHRTADALRDHLGAEERSLLDDELAFQGRVPRDGLPGGVIHADLFRDNALFAGERLSGLIDWYYACNDRFIYDLAVSVNDWCVDELRQPRESHWHALLEAYAALRPFSAQEREVWTAELRASALRFWLSRLYDRVFPRGGDLTVIKDPTPQRRRLEHWRDGQALPLP
ncbi:homoserine kinase [Abyssibacter sp.]|jgi:homoserine kinase type II|uniref:homoserine kinase n=1 Tax=Abyssibacter sp. TaxID=2320200 RepID=UPI0025C6BB6F|nr:homoserine kinase [Abyssibacter sp.]MCK5860114.1 homoserine kinase [Abyssibacter sp.]